MAQNDDQGDPITLEEISSWLLSTGSFRLSYEYKHFSVELLHNRDTSAPPTAVRFVIAQGTGNTLELAFHACFQAYAAWLRNQEL